MARQAAVGRVLATNRVAVTNRFLLRDMGTCLSFDGSSGQVSASSSTSLQLTGSYTIMAWIKPTNLGESNGGRIFHKLGGVEYQFGVTSSNRLFLQNANNASVNSNTNSITLRKWQHVAASYDGVNVTFYVNAVSVGMSAHGGPVSGSNPLLVGNITDGSRTFNGLIDEPAIFKGVALSQSSIEQIMLTGIYPTSNLSLLYTFDEGSGTSATDSSGNNNTGTITTATYSTDVFLKPRTAIP